MEASTLQAPVAIGRLSVSVPLLRLRSDEQLVALFRAGSEDAFRAIHDRYRQRLFAYARQMLGGSRPDAEDAMQDVFVRAYGALRANERPVSLRAWLYRVAHHRCIDQLRRPVPIAQDVLEVSRQPLRDPMLETERREELRRLVADVGRLPEQQRSALLMRELQGLSYEELAAALGVTVAAVKSLLVRARMGLTESADARDATCGSIRADLALACDRGVRASGQARRHLRDCPACREYREQIRGTRRRIAALVPIGPLGFLAKLTGVGGTGVAATGAAAGGGAGLAGGGAVSLASAKLAAIVCCAAAVTAGGASIVGGHHHRAPAAAVSTLGHGAPAAHAAALESEARALPHSPAAIRRTGGTVVPPAPAASHGSSTVDSTQPGSPANQGDGPLTGQDNYGVSSTPKTADPATPAPSETGAPTATHKPANALVTLLLGLLQPKTGGPSAGSPPTQASAGTTSGAPGSGSGGTTGTGAGAVGGAPTPAGGGSGSGGASPPAPGSAAAAGGTPPATSGG